MNKFLIRLPYWMGIDADALWAIGLFFPLCCDILVGMKTAVNQTPGPLNDVARACEGIPPRYKVPYHLDRVMSRQFSHQTNQVPTSIFPY